MERIREKQRVVNFDTLMSDGLVRERLNQRSKSFAALEYEQAANILKQILNKNEQQKKDSPEDECLGYKDKEQELFNLIPFIGVRGSGKTSAMISVGSMLGEYSTKSDEHSDFLGGKNCEFVVLERIDTSILKRNENLMLIILSRMVKYLQKVVENNTKKGYGIPVMRQEELRNLYKEFEDLFKDLIDMEEENPIPKHGSMLQTLLDLNSSHSMPERFRKLTRVFLDYVGKNSMNRCHKTLYLVIQLDDIDLYNHPESKGRKAKSAYTLLEQVYEYLQIPGVVVLATYDDGRLLENCREYLKVKQKGFHDVEWQAKAFLEKVILPRYRIYMPRLNLRDYVDSRQLVIDIGSGEDNR